MRDRLERLLGVKFDDPSLLRTAITHRSAGRDNSERLEFLGDAVLGFVIADALYQRFPSASEGELSRLRSTLVRGETLARLGHQLKLSDHLVMGGGELKSGGFRRDSALEDAMEAIIGATYLDQGLDAARDLVQRLLGGQLDSLRPGDALKDPKTRLQEHQQAMGLPLPEYTLTAASGPDHLRQYQVSCRVDGLDTALSGRGSSQRAAQQAAAAAALDQLAKR